MTLTTPTGVLPLTQGSDFVQADYGGPSGTLQNVSASWVTGSGCNASDFGGFPAGAIAVFDANSRAELCSMTTKATNAYKAGAVAVIMRVDKSIGRARALSFLDYPWYVGMPAGSPIPVLVTSYTVGTVIYNALLGGGAQPMQQGQLNISLSTSSMQMTTNISNIFCDSPQGDPSKLLIIGAHYDCVPDGPGINDNGSGVASLLEIVRAWFKYFSLNDARVVNKVRFAWWAAEELGLIGSFNYVKSLRDSGELNHVLMNLNMDMLGAPNGYPQILGLAGSSSTYNISIVNGTNYITQVLANSIQSPIGGGGPLWNYSAFGGGSDYWAFMSYGVPVGALSGGANDDIDEALAVRYGLLQNVPEDPCYHEACDTLSSVNVDLVITMAKTAGYTMETLATTPNLSQLFRSGQPPTSKQDGV